MPLSESTGTVLHLLLEYLFCLISINITVMSIKYSHLKRNLSETPGTFDVETEDGKSHVQLILNSLFACIELLPLVDVLATCFTPADNQIGNTDKSTVTGFIHRGQKSLSLRGSLGPTVNT